MASKSNAHGSKYRLAWITNLPAPYRLAIFNELAAMGIDLDVFYVSLDKDKREWVIEKSTLYSSAPLELNRLSLGKLQVEFSLRPITRLLRGYDALVVGGWDSIFYLQALKKARKLDLPTALFYESTLETHRFSRGPISWLRTWAFRNAQKVITPGKSATKSVLKYLPTANVIEVFNTVDNQHFSLDPSVVNLDSRGHKYLFVGQLIERKNIYAIIDSFALAAGPDDSLTIAGYGSLAHSLKHYVEKHDLGSQVFFVGRVRYEKLPRLYMEHHTLVLASTNEVWGLVGNEALAMGLQFIVSENCGIAENIREMAGVFIYKNDDKKNLTAAMLKAKSTWSGPIAKPVIRDLATPKLFAEGVVLGLGLKIRP